MIYDLQKGSMTKRLAAWLLDAILLCVLAVGCIWAISDIARVDDHIADLDVIYTRYETEYNTSFDYTQEELDALREEEKAAYDAAVKALNGDQEAIRLLNLTIQSILMMISVGIFLAKLILEFLIPLWLRNGQTIGKKVFGLAVMRTNGVRINGVSLFIRAILGKYAVETMIPVVIIAMILLGMMGSTGLMIMLVLLVVQVCLMIFTSTRAAIHDKLADTVVVDLASQMIFDSQAARLEYQQRVAAEKASEQPY